jgi:ribokinase
MVVDPNHPYPMRILNFGSLNIDYVHRVDHIARPGETIAGRSLEVFAGGKGANQSVALARAGAEVSHAGRVGEDGRWLLEKLSGAGVGVSLVEIDPEVKTGHAVIQVEDGGENAILLHGGANRAITPDQIERALSGFGKGDVLLLQNEVNSAPSVIAAAADRGLSVCLNPAPMTCEVRGWPLDKVSLLIVNETEGEALCGEGDPWEMLPKLTEMTGGEVIVTLGSQGALYAGPGEAIHQPAIEADAVDTTAAGDTFTGYYLARRAAGDPVEQALKTAAAAAALCVAKAGAMDSIPDHIEVTHRG